MLLILVLAMRIAEVSNSLTLCSFVRYIILKSFPNFSFIVPSPLSSVASSSSDSYHAHAVGISIEVEVFSLLNNAFTSGVA